MRIHPIALFAVNDGTDKVAELAKDTTRITHANRHGYNGAILQVLLNIFLNIAKFTYISRVD